MPIRHETSFGAPAYGNGTTPPSAVCAAGAAVPASAATLTALRAIVDVGDLTHGNEVIVDADGSRWRWHATSALTDDGILVVTPAAAPAAGRWLRCCGAVALELPFTAATADNTTLLTLPTGAVFKLDSAHWRITTAMTGGTSSAIGISSSVATTAGDILGGAGGDVLATLTAGRKAGTIGALMDADTELHDRLYAATNIFVFDRVTSAFTAGAGFAVLVGTLIANPGS